MKHADWGALAGRFVAIRALGEGGYGTVFEVFDRERGETVALKQLHRATPRALAAFKAEFRTLSRLRHRNLPRLHELFVDDGVGSFSMELVRGHDLREWAGLPARSTQNESRSTLVTRASSDGAEGAVRVVRPSDDAVSRSGPITTMAIDRVRAVIDELLEVLTFVHQSGLVHCDVKPSNVRVTPEGRVMLLDFGLARPLRRAEGSFVGTMAYAAPEQLQGTISPACDLYAVGALAWELLIGHAPFGTGVDAVENKQRRDPTPLRALLPPEHHDLADLVDGLLSRAAAERERTIGKRGFSIATESVPAFVGRDDVLTAVDDAVTELAVGAPLVMVLEGQSGIGKTTILRAIERRLAASHPDVAVLSARAAEGEHLPFKMLDGVADGLAALRSDDAARPYEVLARAFPVLRVATAPLLARPDVEPETSEDDDMASALREVLAGLGRTVLLLDDAQWADGDSERLLRAALAPPLAPPVLLVLARRPSTRLDVTRLEAEVRTIALGPLSPEETRLLVAAREARPGIDTDLVARESGGHPLFVEELLSAERGSTPRSLGEALASRVAKLDPGPRRLMEIVALATEPLEGRALARMVDRDLGEVTRELDALLRARFVQKVEGSNVPRYAPFHDRLSDAVKTAVSSDEATSIHRAFISYLGERELTAEAMCHHLRAAGVLAEAARFARLAADRARDSMAFESEARFCQIERDLGSEDTIGKKRLDLRHAEALRRAGRSVEAATLLARVAEVVDEREGRALRTNAARLLIAAGELTRGQSLLADVLKWYGDTLPSSEPEALAALLVERIALDASLVAYRLAAHRALPGELDESRLAALRAVAEGLGMIDNLRAAIFQTRAVRLALRSRDPVLRGEMLALEAIFVGSTGRRGRMRARELLRLAVAPFGVEVPRRVAGFVAAVKAVFGRYQRPGLKNLAALAACETFFESLGDGDTWVIWSLRIVRARGARLLGNLNAMRAFYYPLVAKAETHGDVYGAVTLRRGHTLLHLAADRPWRARKELAESRWPSDPAAYHSQDWLLLEARLEATLYEGEIPNPSALEWRRLRRSALHRADTQRILHRYMLARILLVRCSAGDRSTVAEVRALAEVSRLMRSLVRERNGFALAFARVLRAGLGFHRGDVATTVAELRAIVRLARKYELLSLGANASLVLSLLSAGDECAIHASAAADFYRDHGVRNPAAWARIDFPSFAALLRGYPAAV